MLRFKNGFDRTISRGPDDSRIVDTGNGLLGFHRLAIMGLQPEGMQPFALDGSYVVCNGEIYGFETLKQALQEKGYTFQSGSDCEILLPLYREYGVEMFRMLGCGVCVDLIRRRYQKLYRRPGPHRYPSALLRLRPLRDHRLCQ